MNETNTSKTTFTPSQEETFSKAVFSLIDDIAALQPYLERAKWALSEILNDTAEDYSKTDALTAATRFFNCYDDICNAAGVANDYVYEISKEVQRIRERLEDLWNDSKTEKS